jgi:hypothetical protein
MPGGFFPEPGDLLCDVASDGDALWVTTSDRWVRAKGLTLERTRHG